MPSLDVTLALHGQLLAVETCSFSREHESREFKKRKESTQNTEEILLGIQNIEIGRSHGLARLSHLSWGSAASFKFSPLVSTWWLWISISSQAPFAATHIIAWTHDATIAWMISPVLAVTVWSRVLGLLATSYVPLSASAHHEIFTLHPGYTIPLLDHRHSARFLVLPDFVAVTVAHQMTRTMSYFRSAHTLLAEKKDADAKTADENVMLRQKAFDGALYKNLYLKVHVGGVLALPSSVTHSDVTIHERRACRILLAAAALLRGAASCCSMAPQDRNADVPRALARGPTPLRLAETLNSSHSGRCGHLPRREKIARPLLALLSRRPRMHVTAPSFLPPLPPQLHPRAHPSLPLTLDAVPLRHRLDSGPPAAFWLPHPRNGQLRHPQIALSPTSPTQERPRQESGPASISRLPPPTQRTSPARIALRHAHPQLAYTTRWVDGVYGYSPRCEFACPAACLSESGHEYSTLRLSLLSPRISAGGRRGGGTAWMMLAAPSISPGSVGARWRITQRWSREIPQVREAPRLTDEVRRPGAEPAPPPLCKRRERSNRGTAANATATSTREGMRKSRNGRPRGTLPGLAEVARSARGEAQEQPVRILHIPGACNAQGHRRDEGRARFIEVPTLGSGQADSSGGSRALGPAGRGLQECTHNRRGGDSGCVCATSPSRCRVTSEVLKRYGAVIRPGPRAPWAVEGWKAAQTTALATTPPTPFRSPAPSAWIRVQPADRSPRIPAAAATFPVKHWRTAPCPLPTAQIDRPPSTVRRSRALPAGCTWDSRRPLPGRASAYTVYNSSHECMNPLGAVTPRRDCTDDGGGAEALASAHTGGNPEVKKAVERVAESERGRGAGS
ncbi:hypothetical protein C8R44DRAFT_987199 [Mycena epipterygia]|nr:hypothetical protein C8R44DRAFT_987199 [Mycena epipterygia]